MKIDDKLALNLFHVDKKAHIEIDQAICRKCPHKACTRVCPVENYTINEGDVVFAWEGCLECGTCRIVCDQGSVKWTYPSGGFGIVYRHG
ncbi:MAG TPA: 4Fe-4S dicluster domain-containing protein [Dehalococcoidales bacterium]|nr:4Fe-4S dicluster domain-containing protein [Dehalococcoidales bacterium]